MMRSRQEGSPRNRRRRGPPKGVNRLDRVTEGQEKPNGREHQRDGILGGTVSVEVSEALERRTSQSIGWLPSPHFGERSGMVDTVVIHYTVTGTMEETVDLLKTGAASASAHYVIGKDGQIIQMVDLGKKAWHAGTSEFQGRPDVNDFSIGIELVNWGLLKEMDGVLFVWPEGYQTVYQGRSPIYAGAEWWDPFPEMQYRALGELIGQLRVYYPLITPDRIVGHGDVALPRGRKIDPGLAFDWERVRKA